MNESEPCRGFFPEGAVDDTAQAAVMVVVGKSGTVEQVTVVMVSPSGQGFGSAARSCMLSKHFVPALDRMGSRAKTAIRVNIGFRG